eukprot:scaffold23369_cov67-Phaeocystis_antarctica.AAC.6
MGLDNRPQASIPSSSSESQSKPLEARTRPWPAPLKAVTRLFCLLAAPSPPRLLSTGALARRCAVRCELPGSLRERTGTARARMRSPHTKTARTPRMRNPRGTSAPCCPNSADAAAARGAASPRQRSPYYSVACAYQSRPRVRRRYVAPPAPPAPPPRPCPRGH